MSANSEKLFNTLIVLFSIAFSIFVAEYALSSLSSNKVSEERMDPGMILYDADLGWKLKPKWSGNHHHLDYDVRYSINRNGFRGRTFNRTENNYSIIGDSFSFGLGVNDDETFTALLNKNSAASMFNNYSVPGYSTDQQLLLIKKLKNKMANQVVLVVYLGNDIFDNMRDYPLQAEHGKPYYTLEHGSLQLKNIPVPLTPKTAAARKQTISNIVLGEGGQTSAVNAWLARLELSRRLNLFQSKTMLTEQSMQKRFSESLELFSALIIEMQKVITQNGGTLTVALLPGKSYVQQQSSLSAQYQEYFRETISVDLTESHLIKIVDVASQLRALHNSGVEDLYHPNEGHLTVSGHRHVGDFLYSQLISKSLVN